MKPRWINLLALLPLLLAAVIWAWSLLPRHVHIQALDGHLLLVGTDRPAEGAPGNVHWGDLDSLDDWGWDWKWAGFRTRNDQTYGYTTTLIAIPMYSITILAAGLSAVLLAKTRRHQSRVAKNECLKCGYDLRATPDRCPECGSVPASLQKNLGNPSD